MDNGMNAAPKEMMPQAHGGALQRGGPGRPKLADDVAKHIRAALLSNGPGDAIGIVDVLIAKARKGQPWAIQLCLAYGIGKPVETVDASITMTTITATFGDHERGVLAGVIRAAIAEAESIVEGEAVEVTA